MRLIYLDANLRQDKSMTLGICKNYKSPLDRDDANTVTAYVVFFHK